MEYVRIFGDAAGETHFETVELPLPLTDFAPPAPPVGLAAFSPATRFTFCALPLGWYGDWHPTPHRQMFFLLKGVWELTASDGEVRRFGPGSALFVEDTAGKGHITRIVGDEDALAGIVQVPD